MNPDANPDEALVTLRNAGGDEATVSLHGAQLLSWKAGGREQIYWSPLSRPAAGRAVRGGVPVCFPQFGERGPLLRHGLVRTRRWEIASFSGPHSPIAEGRWELEGLPATTGWPHSFRLALAVRLGPGWLELALEAHNTGATPFEFTAALHTYFAVDDVRQAALGGLQGLSYEDALDGSTVKLEPAAALHVSGEIDRVYRKVPPLLELRDAHGLRRVHQDGFADAVVWNPGPPKDARFADMPPQDWTRMLCIEAAAVQRPIQLAAGAAWRGTQRIELPDADGFEPAR